MTDNTMTNERLAALFATHPGIDVFFITADGMPFSNDDAAASHAQRLFDKNLLEINRTDLEDYDPATFADGLEDYTPAPTVPLHPSIAGPYNEFLKAEGGHDETAGGGVIVPASNILAGEEKTAQSIIIDALRAVAEGFKNAAAPVIETAAPIIEVAAAPVVPAAAPIVPAAAPVIPSDAPALTLLQIAHNTPEGERTTHQKGLITKERNAAAKAAADQKEGETK